MAPRMGAVETVSGLAAFDRRAGGSDTERRAATWLRDELMSSRGGDAEIETFWCRPNSALAHAWHVGLGLVGSLLAVASPRLGGVLMLVALLSLVADALLGFSLGRRLTPERASQNVISSAARPQVAGTAPKRIRLIITANYDAGRGGVVYRDTPRAAAARLRRLVHSLTPGWLGWTTIALAWLEVVALMRVGGAHGAGVGLVQLLPTAGLVLTLAALLDVASADAVPCANDNGTGVAVAIAIARALDAAPLRHADVELVLQGASDGTGAGLRHYLRTRKQTQQRTNTVVLGIAASGAGHVAWYESDGPLIPLKAFSRLRGLAREIARREPDLQLAPHSHRGFSPSVPARLRRIPAITIGAVDARGLIPRSHQPTDTPETIESSALDRVVETGMLLVDAIDASLAAGPGRSAEPRPTATPPPAA